MQSLLLILLAIAYTGDSCYEKAWAWGESVKKTLEEYDLDPNYFIQGAINSDCAYDFDSLVNLAISQIKKDSEEQNIRLRGDTLVNWVNWIALNESRYSKEEIQTIREFARKGVHAIEFNEYLKNVDELKAIRIDGLSRKSFGSIAVSIATSDSLQFVFVNRLCQWLTPRDSMEGKFQRCITRPSTHGIFYDSIKTVASKKEIRSISQLFFDELIYNDSDRIALKRRRQGRIHLGCGWNKVAVLLVYNDDDMYKIQFDGINRQMFSLDNAQVIQERFSVDFFTRLTSLFNSKGVKLDGCKD